MVRARRTFALALALLVLSACGSQLDPETVARASGGSQGGQVGAPGVVDGVAPVEGEAGDPGAPGVVDGGAAAPGGDAGGTGDTGGSSGGGGAAAPGGGGGGAGGSAGGGVKAASCDGFKNQTGITDKTITLANVADISGPVPGIFESAQQAARAYISYFNRQGDICGRKLELMALDSRADAGADQQAYVKACGSAFAAVGSMGAFDDGGAGTADSCGIPDIRSVSVGPARQACKSCFAAYAISTNLIPDSAAKWFASKFPTAVKNAAVLYVNAGAAPINAKSLAAGYEKGAGWDFKYEQAIDTAEFNYAPYVQQMKDKGIKSVVYYGPYQFTVKLQQAMKQQGYKPDIYLQDPTIYDRRYIEQAGDVAEGSYIFSANDLFENKSNAEIQLYLSYLQQVKPGAVPNYYGLYAWSATRLFVEKAIALGGKLSRGTMVAALDKTTSWTGNGAHTAMNITTSATPPCLKVAQFSGGSWKQVSPGNYMCGKVINTGIGG